MSKRKRASLGKTPAGSEAKPETEDTSSSAEDSAAHEDMAHVSPDLLAGSPDIWSSKTGETVEPKQSEPEATELEAARPAPAEPEPTSAEAEPEVAAPHTETTEPEMASEAPAALAPPFYPTAPPAQPRLGGSSTALGVVLVVVGIFALVIVLSGVDLTTYGWPLFVIIPGVTLLVVGFFGVGPGASIPGGMITMLGVVLAYQNSTGDWPTWAFAWTLVAPFGVGLGIYPQALRDRDMTALRRGRTLIFIGLLMFMIGFVLFESILGISGQEYGFVGKAALPALLILVGIILLVRSIQGRKA